MERWIVMAGVYAWLGFTAGYYVHKWLERNLPGRQEAVTPAEPPAPRQERP